MITWFTGQSGAGKTTRATILRRLHGGVVLDGDAMREVWPGLGFTMADRMEQNYRLARLARVLHEQGTDVIVASICPWRSLRAACTELTAADVRWVYVSGGRPVDADHPYEPPLARDGYQLVRGNELVTA